MVSGCEEQPGAGWDNQPHPCTDPPREPQPWWCTCSGATPCQGVGEQLQLPSLQPLRKGKRQLRHFSQCNTRKDYFRGTYTTHKQSPVQPTLLEQPEERAPVQTARGESSPRAAALEPSQGKGTQAGCTPRAPIACNLLPKGDTITATANAAGAAANEAPADAAAAPALYKSFTGFEEDPSQEHAAGAAEKGAFQDLTSINGKRWSQIPATTSPFNGASQWR